MRSYVAKPEEARNTRNWWVVDAKDQPLGRLASRIATLLRGKHKATYTPNVDTGDFVIVVNASQVKLTGRKSDSKKYYRFSGHPGGLKAIGFKDVIESDPTRPIEQAVKGMLPKNVLGREMLSKLKVYGGPDHPHQAQQPAPKSW